MDSEYQPLVSNVCIYYVVKRKSCVKLDTGLFNVSLKTNDVTVSWLFIRKEQHAINAKALFSYWKKNSSKT